MSIIPKVDVESLAILGDPNLHLEDDVLLISERGIFGLADGFGGSGKSGLNAAKTCLRAIREFLEREVGDRDATLPFVLKKSFSFAGNILFNSFVYANRKLRHDSQSVNLQNRGAASCVVGFFDGPLLILGSVGSCEAWLLRKGEVFPLLIPRTQERVVSGGLSPGQPFNRIPLVGLGMFDDLEPEIHEYRVRAGDRVLLSSGGLLREDIDSLIAFPEGGLSQLKVKPRFHPVTFVMLHIP